MKKHGMILVKNMKNEKAKLFQEEIELLKTRTMLNKLIQLNLSLYHAILNFAERKGIPISLDSTILQLAEEIEKTDIVTFPSDDSYHEPRNRRKVNGTEKSYSLNIKRYKNMIKCKDESLWI